MRFGLYVPNQGPFADAGLLAELAGQAEGAGWDGFFIWDEILPVYDYAVGRQKGPEDGDADWDATVDAIVALTAVAAATRTIRFGALVSPVARLRPEVFAHQTAALDRFSGGRLVVGVGLGNPDTQFSAFGLPTDPRQRAEMLDEFLAVLDRLWTGEPVDLDGRHFRATGVALRPPPIQQPRIPVWVGADSANRAPRRRAARWDGFAPASPGWPNAVIDAATCREMRDEIDAARRADAAAEGAAPGAFDLVVFGDAAGGGPSPAEVADYEANGVTWVLVQVITPQHAAERIPAGPPAGMR